MYPNPLVKQGADGQKILGLIIFFGKKQHATGNSASFLAQKGREFDYKIFKRTLRETIYDTAQKTIKN